MQKILIVSLSNVSTDPRILRQIEALSPFYEIHVVGYGLPVLGVSAYHELMDNSFGHSKFKRKFMKVVHLIFRRYRELYFYETRTKFRNNSSGINEHFDLILANDFDSLPLIKYCINDQIDIFLDAHEYFFDELNNALRRRIYRPYRNWIAATNMSRVVGISTVSKGIANLYRQEFGPTEISLVRNVPKRSAQKFQDHDSDSIEIIHHGAAVEGRGIRELIKLIAMLDDRFHLNLMLVQNDKNFYSDIQEQSRLLGNRVKFLQPVPTNDIVSTISRYDLGIHLIPPSSVNNELALPNKFFEFIQASLGIIIGPSPEMSEIVNRHSLGVVSDSFDLPSIAVRVNEINRSQVEEFRLNSHLASNIYNWDEESSKLTSRVDKYIGLKNE